MKQFLYKIKNKIFNLLKLVLKNSLLGKKPENMVFIRPDYYIINKLTSNSLIFDIGTGNDANFSQDLIKHFGLKSYGFDPTRKHYEALKQVEKESQKKFTIFNYALSDKSGEAEFNESSSNISGSFFCDHINIKNDNIKKYVVKIISLQDIFSKLAITKVDLVKIDVEGEEYKIIDSLTKNLTEKIDQFVFEFHHHCIDKYSILDNLKAIKKMGSLGFYFYSNDGINYLFYKNND